MCAGMCKYEYLHMYIRTHACMYVWAHIDRYDAHTVCTYVHACYKVLLYVHREYPPAHALYEYKLYARTFHVMVLRVLFPGGGTQGPW